METRTEFDLDELHRAMAADIAAAFPVFQTVEAYREDERKTLPVPACLIDLVEMPVDSEGDPGSGQLGLELEFACVVVEHFMECDPLAIRQRALDLAVWLHQRRFNKPPAAGQAATIAKVQTPGAARVTGVYPDDFKTLGTKRDGELPQYLCWRVEFRINVWAGKSQVDDALYNDQDEWQ